MARTTQAKKKWTVMVYLAGDNNLDSAGAGDLAEMKSVGSTRDISIVAQFDRSGSKRVTNRYFLQKGTRLDEDVVTALGETNTGDPAVLRDFVKWAVTEHPAQRYMLVIWNHGSGWDDSNLYEGDYFSGATPPVVRKAIAFDDQAKDFLDNIELKRVLAEIRRTLGRKIDILGFDACLMSMVEVAYQIRDAVALTCGSEEEEPGDGWPYDTILKALAAKPSMAPRALADLVVKNYLASYKPNEGVTFSATDVSASAKLATAVNGLGAALTRALADPAARGAIVAVRAQVQEYSSPYDQYCDLADLCALLVRGVKRPDLTRACDTVRAALAKAVIRAGAKGKRVAHSSGVSIYFPKKTVSSLYATLDFSKKGAWASFIANYTRSLGRRR